MSPAADLKVSAIMEKDELNKMSFIDTRVSRESHKSYITHDLVWGYTPLEKRDSVSRWELFLGKIVKRISGYLFDYKVLGLNFSCI